MNSNILTLWKCLLVVLTLLILGGCSGNSGSSVNGTGGVTAKLVWGGAKTSAKTLALAPTGVATVRFIISGSGMTTVQQDFAATAGTGTMSGVLAGSGRTLTAQGLDGSGTVTHQGLVSNVNVQINQTTDVGIITMLPVNQPSGELTIYDDFSSWNTSKWEGHTWSGNIDLGSWAPTVTSGHATLAIDDYSWGEIRSTATVSKGQAVTVTLTPWLSSGGVNADGAYIILSTNWCYYSSPDAIGLRLDDAGKVRAWSQAGGDLSIIGTYTSGSPIQLTLTWNSNGTMTMSGGGGSYTTPTAVFISSSPRVVIVEGNSRDGIEVDVVSMTASNAGGGSIQLPKTGQTTSYAAGDDGALQKGVAWPSPRFTDNNNGTVTDNLTGLIWLKNANCFGPKTWVDALTVANTLTSGACGLTDGSTAGQWRLPNRKELFSMIDFNQSVPISSLNRTFILPSDQSYNFWTSSTHPFMSDMAWYIFMDGEATCELKNSNKNLYGNFYAWPVRSETMQLPRTGQTTSYTTGDDGTLQKGAIWPNPRFNDNNNGTLSDLLTGLIWLKNANCTDTVGGILKTIGPLKWTDALVWTNNLASGNCGLNDNSVSGDWRLPNIRELESLVSLALNPTDGSALPFGHSFINIGNNNYWSSTSYAWNPSSNAWSIPLTSPGSVDLYQDKNYPFYVLPVRGGQ